MPASSEPTTAATISGRVMQFALDRSISKGLVLTVSVLVEDYTQLENLKTDNVTGEVDLLFWLKP